MIERKLISERGKDFQIEEFIMNSFQNVGISNVKVQRTPLGEKIVITALRPGLVVGREGQNIRRLTAELKKKFGLENPQVEIQTVDSPFLDPHIVAEKIANTLERFGITRFKAVGHRAVQDVMNAGAIGVEIIISGKVPSRRAKRWRFYAGYLKKCGDIAIEGVKKAYAIARLKPGVVGIQVRIMPPDVRLSDKIKIGEEVEEVKVEEKDENKGTESSEQ
ncbi:30S ribosomal protein S3 [Candidatus Woesearchaeota archaeon]|nr:30S ribosomal protein S3 [Candidatus Woesearchaeota archaeon]RLE40882.1 MAG: 30S ribosomal protein S3 [Candidatus Woesearchaeota archaeon]